MQFPYSPLCHDHIHSLYSVVAVDPEPPFCTLHPHCTSYNDGCNNCKCMPNGDDACTKKMCLNMDSLPPAQCTSCDDGYTMDSTGSCIADEGILYPPYKLWKSIFIPLHLPPVFQLQLMLRMWHLCSSSYIEISICSCCTNCIYM